MLNLPGPTRAALAMTIALPVMRPILADEPSRANATGTPADSAAVEPASPDASSSSSGLEDIVITARHLNAVRGTIETQTGASTYTIDSAAIQAMPTGDNTLLNQVILQAPDVAQDSFGQLHIRGEHNGLQYRLNGIILPEGISVFGQSLDPRLIDSMKLITGALPAEYGLRTAGIIDLTTKSGVLEPRGAVSLYGGSHSQIEPSFFDGGSVGALNYFVTGDFLRGDLGIESPTSDPDPLHDETKQYHGFGYFEYILDPSNRVGWILGTSRGKFQIPAAPGNIPLGYPVNGITDIPGGSAALNENQTEITHYAIVSYQHSQAQFDLQTSLIARYSSLTFSPDPQLGDLLYNGISQNAFKRDVAYGWQTDSAFHLIDRHTIRAGFYVQHDRATSATTSQVLPTDSAGAPTTDIPVAIVDNGDSTQNIESVYLQDEWQVLTPLTINYGLRYDHLSAFTSGHQLNPRVNIVWKPLDGMTLHGGYSRYFSPPPFELVGSKTIQKFLSTTGAPAATQDDPPVPETANYYDVGIEQLFAGGFTAGVDTYYKQSKDLIDEGQFGAPIILTTFNYRYGRQYGAVFNANYAIQAFAIYANFAVERARGKQIESAQFNFSADDLAYITDHYISLDHEQQMTASAGASYTWGDTKIGADMLFGSGLRAALVLPDGSTIPNGTHLPYYRQANFGLSHTFAYWGSGSSKSGPTLRFDVINVFDTSYQIRNGTGVGVGAPQYGPRRGFFGGISIPF
jgi:outer membrane receptor protein involved in Fe transport